MEQEDKLILSMKRLLFLMFYLLFASGTFAADIVINITATVGIPFEISPKKDSGATGTIYNQSGYGHFTNESDKDFITESTTYTNKHVTYSYLTLTYYDYKITPLKVGVYYFDASFSWSVSKYENSSNDRSKSIQYVIRVVDVSTISIPETLSLITGNTYTFTPTIVPSDATPILSWYSSNPSIASVENGTVNALTEGTATITCIANNGVSATCEVTINPQMNYLYSADFAGGAGGHVTLPVLMENDINVAGFQFDLIMPEGVTLTTKNDGTADATVTSRTSTHTLTGTTLTSGAVRFTVFSLSNALITGTEGSVMNIRFDIDKNTPLGDYEVKFTNVQLTQKNGPDLSTIYAPDQTLKLTVGSIMPGDVNADGVVNVTDAIGIISYILEDTPTWFTESVADVNGDEQINVTDVIGIIDMIMSESTTKTRYVE